MQKLNSLLNQLGQLREAQQEIMLQMAKLVMQTDQMGEQLEEITKAQEQESSNSRPTRTRKKYSKVDRIACERCGKMVASKGPGHKSHMDKHAREKARTVKKVSSALKSA